MDLDPTLKSFDEYEKENSVDFNTLSEDQKNVKRRRRRVKRVLNDHEYEADVYLKQRSGRRARKLSLMEPHRQVLRNEKKNKKKFTVRTLPELLQQSEDRLKLYEGSMQRLLTAHRCFAMIFASPPQKRVMRRAKYFANRAALERARSDKLREAVKDCGDSEIMQREVLTAMHQKHSTPGFGKEKELIVDHNDPRDVARVARKRAKKFREKTKKRLQSLDNKYPEILKELPPVSSVAEATMILMSTMRYMRDVACTAYMDRHAVRSEVSEKKLSKAHDRRALRLLKSEAVQVLRDMEALGCDVRTFVGSWVGELLAEKPILGRKPKKK